MDREMNDSRLTPGGVVTVGFLLEHLSNGGTIDNFQADFDGYDTDLGTMMLAFGFLAIAEQVGAN